MQDYEKTISTICNYMGEQHPWICAAMAQKQKYHLSKKLAAYHGNTIAYGPFKGLKFVDDSHWGQADKGSMILGLYKQEMLNELIAIPAKYDVFIDLGAADGYYGVGVLVNQLFKKSYCYEITEHGRAVIEKNATINGLLDKVVIRGEATKNIAHEIPHDELRRSVLFVDIEGAEFDLFDADVFSCFKKSIIFVELHNWVFEDGDAKLHKFIENSNKTHAHKILKMGSRDLSSYPELQKWNDLDRWLLCSEGRAQLMSWIRFDPV